MNICRELEGKIPQDEEEEEEEEEEEKGTDGTYHCWMNE